MDHMESSASETSAQAQALINWELAASTAARLTPAGPTLGSAEIGAAVENLRLMADISVPHVHDITGLEAARDLRDSSVLVVDRASWAKANTQSFAVMLKPAMEKMLAGRHGTLNPGAAAVSGAITGSQLGAILAFLSSKVLGQYDPFSALAENSTAPAAGRLLLVAPNIITVERELNVEPADFRLWVCLHEQTHRVQFAAAPWLRHHMLGEIENLSGQLLGNVDSLLERAAAAAKSLKDRSSSGAPGRGAILELLQNPEEKAALSRLTALMSLLEGHANVVMDGVDASIVPSVTTIRQRFTARGEDRGVIEKFIRNLLGLDAKMRQYSDGAKFVREVVAAAGMQGFNKVWESAGQLPSEAEIHDSKLWLERMGL
ncbi:MAG: hydrolase [Arthrobacter sp.]|jgi:coenzyme F420 biosynthesis associated uncharacterized protein|nr:hydrolase [Arthrobacter sp.]